MNKNVNSQKSLRIFIAVAIFICMSLLLNGVFLGSFLNPHRVVYGLIVAFDSIFFAAFSYSSAGTVLSYLKR